MDFGLSDDQKLLEETVRGFLSTTVPIERVRELRNLDCPNDRATWSALAELGATGVLVPERFGGSDLSLLDACLISQSLGHAVTPTAFLSSGVIVPVVLREIESPRTEAWLRGIALGELVVGAAVTELFAVREGAGVRLGDGGLEGKALMALDACGADHVLVALDEARIAIVDARAEGLAIERLVTTDRRSSSSGASRPRPSSRTPPERSRAGSTPAGSRWPPTSSAPVSR